MLGITEIDGMLVFAHIQHKVLLNNDILVGESDTSWSMFDFYIDKVMYLDIIYTSYSVDCFESLRVSYFLKRYNDLHSIKTCVQSKWCRKK